MITTQGTPVVKDEAYWHSKHPEIIQLYQGRPLPVTGKMYDLDVRRFRWPDDYVLRNLIGAEHLGSTDMCEAVMNVQKWVVKNLKYVSDTVLGAAEYWLFPVETAVMLRDDCEGGACLIASLLLNILPREEHWRVRVAAGWVQASPTAPQGGHGYCTLCRPQDNEWVVVDWCYLEDSNVPVKDKSLHKDNTPYRDVWFSFNYLHAWSHQHFALSGRLPPKT